MEINKESLAHISKELYPDIYITKSAQKELNKIIDKTGSSKVFVKKLATILEFLQRNRNFPNIIENNPTTFEKLKNNDCYSIRFKVKGNIRLLFNFFEDENGNIIIIAAAFKEKSKSDYVSAINKACTFF